jgi:hypothetical protein
VAPHTAETAALGGIFPGTRHRRLRRTEGIRRLVREHCEASAFIPIERTMESLNVSNAAAIALYELRRAGTSA